MGCESYKIEGEGPCALLLNEVDREVRQHVRHVPGRRRARPIDVQDRVHGLTLTVQNAPGAGSSYDVLVRVEGANHVLLIGATGHIAGNSTSANMSFGIFLDPKDIENVIVVIDEG